MGIDVTKNRMRTDNKHEHGLSVPETKAARCVFIAPPMFKSDRGLRKNIMLKIVSI